MLIRPTQNYNNLSCKASFLNNSELQNYIKKSSTVELSKFKNILERMNKVDDGLVYFFRENVRKVGENRLAKDESEITCFSKDKTGNPNRILRFIPAFGYSDVLSTINKHFAEFYPEIVKTNKVELVDGINKLLANA